MFQFENLVDFMHMSGHGPYVWTAYLISLTLMLLLVVIPLWRKQKILKQISRERRREMAQKQAQQAGT